MIFMFLGCTMVTLRSETLLYIDTSYDRLQDSIEFAIHDPVNYK